MVHTCKLKIASSQYYQNMLQQDTVTAVYPHQGRCEMICSIYVK